MKNALFRLSKYSGDKNVFNDYTINALQQTASQMDGYLNYACALGGQNGIPTLVSYADHTIHAIARRTGIQYSYAIIAMLLERLEMESLGERIIELQEDAPNWTSSRNQKRCVVALYGADADSAVATYGKGYVAQQVLTYLVMDELYTNAQIG